MYMEKKTEPFSWHGLMKGIISSFLCCDIFHKLYHQQTDTVEPQQSVSSPFSILLKLTDFYLRVFTWSINYYSQL